MNIEIDGAAGEGGGQILRTALALSLLTQEAFRIQNIRSRRDKPGLRPQHLASIKAASEVGHATCEGADLNSTQLTFTPRGCTSGRYHFDIRTAGSTSLVLQTVFFPLSQLPAASSVRITGGTHVPMSPSFHYSDLHWLVILDKIGFQASLSLKQAGFYPEGGGEIQADIEPAKEIKPIHLVDRGRIRQIRGISGVANLDRRIAERQRMQVLHRISALYPLNDIRIQDMPSRFKGTHLLLLAEFESSQACFTSLGAIGKPAEKVADEAVDALLEFLATDGAVDPYLADQLLLPQSLADGVSQVRTSKVTNHLLTNAEVIQSFLPVQICIDGEFGKPGTITIKPQH